MSAPPRVDGPVLLFDGVCNLCSGTVQFVIEHDPEGVFRFAPLQSATAERILEDIGYGEYDFDSFVLVEGGEYYTKSDAALRIARGLDRPWSHLWLGRFVPRVLRDAVYDVVASHRYAIFGKKDRCMVPTPEVRDRFLEMSPADPAESD